MVMAQACLTDAKAMRRKENAILWLAHMRIPATDVVVCTETERAVYDAYVAASLEPEEFPTLFEQNDHDGGVSPLVFVEDVHDGGHRHFISHWKLEVRRASWCGIGRSHYVLAQWLTHVCWCMNWLSSTGCVDDLRLCIHRSRHGDRGQFPQETRELDVSHARPLCWCVLFLVWLVVAGDYAGSVWIRREELTLFAWCWFQCFSTGVAKMEMGDRPSPVE